MTLELMEAKLIVPHPLEIVNIEDIQTENSGTWLYEVTG